MRLSAPVSPNSWPVIQATRSNSASATRPQLSPPTISSTAATTLRVFTLGLLRLNTMTTLYRNCIGLVKYMSTQSRGATPRRKSSMAPLRGLMPRSLYRCCTVTRMAIETGPSLRIGELSRRVGVSPELLRAWERRYGLLEPTRTDGGLRLYSAADVRRVRAMQAHLQSGLSAAEAARLARSDEGAAAEPANQPALRDAAELQAALDGLDAQGAHLVL